MAKSKKTPRTRRSVGYLLAGLLALLPAAGAHAQNPQVRQTTLVDNYDVTTAGYTYLFFGDRNSAITKSTGVWGPGTAVARPFSSSTTTLTSVGSLDSFIGLAVGDLLLITIDGVENERTIATFTSANEVVVNAALSSEVTSQTFRFKKRRTGTAATDGWFYVGDLDHFNVQFEVATINATSLTATLECRVSKFGAANTLFEQTFTAVGAESVSVSTSQEECRVGWKIDTDGGAQNVAVYINGVK